MNKNLGIALAVVGLVLVGFGGFYFGKDSGVKFGTVINPSNALNQLRLINDFNSITLDLQGLRSPLAGVVTGSATLNTATVATTTGASASTTITLTGALVGDYLVWGESTSTVNAALTCEVTAANLATCYKWSVGGSVSAVTSTLFVSDLPKASFIAPAALQTSTST